MIDNRSIGSGDAGPVWKDLLDRYRTHVNEETR
jgi:hypothetical protein